MKKIFIAIHSISLCLLLNAQSNIDVLHYKFEIGLSDQSDSIEGKTWVTIKFAEPSNNFRMGLASLNNKGRGMIVSRVFENKESVSATQNNDILNISLNRPAEKNETRTYEILYKGIPADGLIISKNKYGDRTFFADNWPDRAHNWIPCKDEPGDKATFEFVVTAPVKYSVISNGKKTEEKIVNNNKKLTHWVEDIPLSTKVMVIGVAKFAVKIYKDSPPEIPVSAWVYPQDSTNGFTNYSVAPTILKFFTNYIAPYPYNKLANVQSKIIFGGMENASCIFYDETTAFYKRNVESLLAHEIAHQWFGDMASEKSFPHLWLSEGFATYLTHLYIAHKYGIDSMNIEMKADREQVISFAKISSHPVVDSISTAPNLLNPNSYQKGSWVLHMLHRELGSTVFQQILRGYYEKYKGGNANTRDFESVAEKISGKNLNIFFNQWLYRAVIPHLKITWQYSGAEKNITLTVEQTQASEPFQFPLDISIITNTKKSVIHTVQVNQKKQSFEIPVSVKPVSVIADPFTSLLFEGKISEIK
ncbi:MAG: DUF3458 domain-containing protein [Bacteroidetes bacterium]|nr:DUF3458 domain-containing protein [Bacteroidota bacterium]MBS1931366.1 DUF3458 domain-containing protein [Bacteroidota bacterium]